VFALRQELLESITRSLAEQAHRRTLTQDTARCPYRGRLFTARSPVPQTVETLVGTVTLE
jgi:hypothetical protein